MNLLSCLGDAYGIGFLKKSLEHKPGRVLSENFFLGPSINQSNPGRPNPKKSTYTKRWLKIITLLLTEKVHKKQKLTKKAQTKTKNKQELTNMSPVRNY